MTKLTKLIRFVAEVEAKYSSEKGPSRYCSVCSARVADHKLLGQREEHTEECPIKVLWGYVDQEQLVQV